MYENVLGTCIECIFVKNLVILALNVVAILDFRVTGVPNHKNNVRNGFPIPKNVEKEVSLDLRSLFYKT